MLIEKELLRAIKQNDLDTLKILFGHGVSVETKLDGEMTLLIYAAMFAPNVVPFLTLSGANVNAMNEDKCTPLLCSASNGDADTTRVLLQYGANPQLGNKFGTTPLMIAAMNGHADVVDLLIQAGADVISQNSSGHGAIDYAVRNGSKPIIKRLIDCGAKIGESNVSKDFQ